MDNKDHIEEIIKRTFDRLKKAYDNHKEGAPWGDADSRIVFPKYRGKNDIRVSEQELRFVFVETFNLYCKGEELDWYYSVETPTRDKYSFGKKNEPRADEDGRSGEFDLVLFNKEGKRIALIEFKANNASAHDHIKDFVKLDNTNEYDEGTLHFFIEVVKNADDRTKESLSGKVDETKGTMFRCYSLEKEEKVSIKKISKKTP